MQMTTGVRRQTMPVRGTRNQSGSYVKAHQRGFSDINNYLHRLRVPSHIRSPARTFKIIDKTKIDNHGIFQSLQSYQQQRTLI